MWSPVAWSAGRRDSAELAIPGWHAWGWLSLRARPPCPSCRVRKWQKPGCALPGAGHTLHTHTHTLPRLWQAKQCLLYLTGGSCLQPGHHLHGKPQGSQHLIPMGQPLPHGQSLGPPECKQQGRVWQCCCDRTWGCMMPWGFSGKPRQTRTSSPDVAKGAVMKDTTQEDHSGTNQRGTSPCPPGGRRPPQTHC